MKYTLLLVILFISQNTIGQNKDQGVELMVEVKELDSQYVLIPKLKVISQNDSIEIPGRLSYTNEVEGNADCNIYMLKKMGDVYVHIYLPRFAQPIINDDLKFRTFKSTSQLSDTIDLNSYVPLEPGRYVTYVKLRYYRGNNEFSVISNFCDFSVRFIAKEALFFHKKVELNFIPSNVSPY